MNVKVVGKTRLMILKFATAAAKTTSAQILELLRGETSPFTHLPTQTHNACQILSGLITFMCWP